MNLNKHRIAWIGFAVGIVLVILITWMAAVSPCLDKIHNADEQTAQIEAQNEKTQKKIDQLMIASETMTIQRARLKQLQAQLPPVCADYFMAVEQVTSPLTRLPLKHWIPLL